MARTATFVAELGGNILHADHHIDTSTGLFLMRLEWDLNGFALGRADIHPAFTPLGEAIEARWSLHFSDVRSRVAVWVSHEPHCLVDLLLRQRTAELSADIPLVISNHEELGDLVRGFGVTFCHVPVDDRGEHEHRQLALLRDHSVDLVVLAKYMRVLSPGFLAAGPSAINIHHSFLPAFAGRSPYRQAHERGVKIIGATAHYVTEQLDGGPIIEQDVVRVSHRDAVEDLMRKGRDVERTVLARAVRVHLEHRVIVHGNRTSVFD